MPIRTRTRVRPRITRRVRTALGALVSTLLVLVGALTAVLPAAAAGTATLTVSIAPATTPIPAGADAQWIVNYECSSVDTAVTTCDNAVISVAVAKLSPLGNPIACVVGGSTGNGDFTPTSTGFVGTGAGGSIPVGASGQLTFTCKTSTGVTPDQSTLVATATFTSDSAVGPATATAAPIVVTSSPAVTVDKQLLGNSVLDGITAYRITGDYIKHIPGNGEWNTRTPVLVDSLPVGAVFVSASNGGVYDAASHTITWPSSAFPPANNGSDIEVFVQVRYPSSVFGAADTVENRVSLTATTVTDASQVSAADSVAHTFSNDPGGTGRLTKTVSPNYEAPRAIFKTDTFRWVLAVENTGQVPIGGTVYDYPPCQSAPLAGSLPEDCTDPGFRLVSLQNVPRDSVLTFHLADGTVETVTKTTDATASYAIPSGWLVAGYSIELPDGAVNPGSRLTILASGTLTDGNDYAPMTQTNCAQWSLTDADPTVLVNPGDTDKVCAVAYFKNADADLQIRKSYTGGPDALVSGEFAPWRLIVSNRGAANDPHYIDAPVKVTDTLPTGVTYVPGSAVVTGESGAWTYDADFVTANMTVTQVGQTLTFAFPDGTILDKQHGFTIDFETVVNAGLGASTQTNTASVWNPADTAWVPSAGKGQVSSASFSTGTSTQASSQKQVKGEFDSQFLFSTAGSAAIGTTSAGGEATFQLRIGSLGSTAIDDLLIYDILPYVGDTGVSAGQTTVERGSEFQPELTGALTLPTGVTATYSTSTDPCRPEIIPDASNPGCDPVWLTEAEVTDWADIRAVRIDATGKTYPSGTTEIVEYTMTMPPSAEPGEVAWNSLAYVAAGPSGALLPTEPVKVGIRIAQPPAVTIVKEDADGNDANSVADAVTVAADATTALTFTITNSGGERLRDIEVTDAVTDGEASVTDLTCTFPDGSTGTTWAGPFEIDATFTCSATLDALGFGVTHADVATVTGIGEFTGETATDDDPYHAVSEPATIQVLKVGEDRNGDVVPMDGSRWAIYNAADATTPVVDSVASVTGATGLFSEDGLPAGTYWLEETRALPGFELLAERVEFTIGVDGTVTLATGTAPIITVVELDGVFTIRVQDVPAMELPQAGGSGSLPFTLAGLVTLLIAAALAVTFRRRTRISGLC